MATGRRLGGDGGAREHAEQKKMKGRGDWRGSSCGRTGRKARVCVRDLDLGRLEGRMESRARRGRCREKEITLSSCLKETTGSERSLFRQVK
jgi:hypothetical protein